MTRHPGVFPEDVPKSDVYRADYVRREFRDALFVAEVQRFPVAVDLARVFADEKGFDGGIEVGFEGVRASPNFGETSDVFVGSNLQDRSADS